MIEMQDVAKAFAYARRQRAWVSQQSRENAWHRNQPGSVSAPHWTGVDEIEAVTDSLNGHEDRTVFNPRHLTILSQVLKDWGFSINGPDEMFPYSMHANDPDIIAWSSEVWHFSFRPNGTLYTASARSMGYKHRFFDENRIDEQFRELIMRIEGTSAATQRERADYLARMNEMRAERNLPLFVSWTHAKNPSNYRFKDAS